MWGRSLDRQPAGRGNRLKWRWQSGRKRQRPLVTPLTKCRDDNKESVTQSQQWPQRGGNRGGWQKWEIDFIKTTAQWSRFRSLLHFCPSVFRAVSVCVCVCWFNLHWQVNDSLPPISVTNASLLVLDLFHLMYYFRTIPVLSLLTGRDWP